MENKTVIEESLELIEGLIDTLSENSDNIASKKMAKLIDRAEDNGVNVKGLSHEVSVNDLNPRQLRVAAGLKKRAGEGHPKSVDDYIEMHLEKNAEEGKKKRSESKFNKEYKKPSEIARVTPDYLMVKSVDNRIKKERKEAAKAKKAKIKESLESLISSNLSESTKIEILESIKSYLVD